MYRKIIIASGEEQYPLKCLVNFGSTLNIFMPPISHQLYMLL